MIYAILFLFGLAIGSFLYVIASRYRKEGIGGRSHCPQCGKILAWHELVPLASFLIQRGKCRHCAHRLSWRYPASEILAGLILTLIPWQFGFSTESALWILALLILLLIAFIDLRLSIIPDGLNVSLGLIGVRFLAVHGYNNAIGFGVGALIFGLIIAATKGKGMGMGDLKLAAVLGLIFGWPKILLIIMAAFLVGGIWAAGVLLLKHKSLKDAIPFGPFLAIASAFVLFFGDVIMNWLGYVSR
ncbi:MAG: prepilin peptidase [Patescibacteria group bacterium]